MVSPPFENLEKSYEKRKNNKKDKRKKKLCLEVDSTIKDS